MAAWIAVVDHPFFAVTDVKGRFEIKGLPPGKYTLEAWHEKLRSVAKEVEVKAGGTATADFTLEENK